MWPSILHYNKSLAQEFSAAINLIHEDESLYTHIDDYFYRGISLFKLNSDDIGQLILKGRNIHLLRFINGHLQFLEGIKEDKKLREEIKEKETLRRKKNYDLGGL